MSSVKRRVPRTIPTRAEEKPCPEGGFDYWLDGRRVARVYYHPTGAMEWERHFDTAGRPHGVERYGHDNGRVKWRARYRNGLQVGFQRQWDEAGGLLVTTRFVRGTGVDLWFNCGRLSEERHFKSGKRHGVERWWDSKRTVWQEQWFAEGIEHGVTREWNAKGHLRRGFPQYFVRGEKVTRRAYEKALRTDPTLPPLDARDNSPRRRPPEFSRDGRRPPG